MATDTKGIFVSYRRGESGGYAGRIADTFIEHFGEHRVFHDVDSIEPGVDFVDQIQRALDSSEVLIAVIGKNWVTSADAAGKKRLENPNDYVRTEIAAALQRNIRVIPVLVQGASMPSADELPDDLAPLSRRNAFELHDASWREEVQHLITVLERVVGRKEEEAEGEAEPRSHKEDSSPPRGQDSTASTPPEKAQRGHGSAQRRTRWGQIGVAVFLAGMITLVPQLVWIELTGTYTSSSFVWGILHPLVLFCGLWVGLAWPGRHTKGHILLGVCAAMIDQALQVVFGWQSSTGGTLLSFVGIVALFTAGGRFGDLIESWRKT